MSIIHFESGTQTSAAAKAFCSVCLTIGLIAQPLSFFLQDIQILLFWSGIIFIILSIIPLFEWICIYSPVWWFYDRHLPKEAFLLRSTLNQPFWDRFLTDTIRDLYLVIAFVIITFRQLGKPLFDEHVWIDLYSEFNSLLIPTCLLLAIFVLSKILYRLYNHLYDVRLTQHYLTIVTTSGQIINELNTYYINKSIPLFRQRFLAEFKRIRTDIQVRIKQVTTFLSRDMINNKEHFRSFQGYMNTASNLILGIRLTYHISFKDIEGLARLDQIRSNLQIISNIFYYLYLEEAPEGVPYLLFSKKTVQEKKHWKTYSDLLNRAIERANYPPSILSNKDVSLFYEDLVAFKQALGDMTKELDSVIAQGEKNRGYVSFLKSFPFISRLLT